MSRKPKCPIHHTELVCPKCQGLKGARKAKRNVSAEQFREWGKRGGRPKKTKSPDSLQKS